MLDELKSIADLLLPPPGLGEPERAGPRARRVAAAMRAWLPASVGLSVQDVPTSRDPAGEAAVVAPRRRAEFLAGRACAGAALASIGVTPGPIPIGPDRAPVWPAGMVGSVSHGAGVAGAIVGRRRDWRAHGLDLERGGPLPPGLASRIAAHEELALLAQLGLTADPGKLAFSAKEAVFKAHWPLRKTFLRFEDVVVVDADPTANGFVALARVRGDADAAEWSGRLDLVDGIVVAVVAMGPSA